MTTTPEAKFLTVPEVAQHLRINPATIRRWIADGRIPAVKIGRSYRVEAAQVRAVIDSHRTSRPLVVTTTTVTR